jgi:hypothetical protein
MITIGFSSHHAEALPFARYHMEQHQLIVLEDPPSPHFADMLRGRLSVDDYIMELDSAFPRFERLMCGVLRELYDQGVQIMQVEPYLERLLRIHQFLAEGKTPEDVVRDPLLEEVYLAEKGATGTLLHYYAQSLKAPFEEVVEAVKGFAMADAARLKLRQRLRSEGIKSLVTDDVDIYVEAGYIHFPLHLYLRRDLRQSQRIRIVYLLAPMVRKMEGRRRNLGPGDILTLLYILHGRVPKERANLLAARSLIYVKLLQKEELIPGSSDAPHCEDIANVNRIVDRLGLHECRLLFDQIRLAKRERALELVSAYGKDSAAA